MEKLLFVDDRSKRIHSALRKYTKAGYEVTIAPSVKEALRLISNTDFDVISLDHDLNGDDFQDPNDSTSGMEIVRWIKRCGWPHLYHPPEFIIHTHNAFAGTMMQKELADYGMFRVCYAPYDYDEDRIEWQGRLR